MKNFPLDLNFYINNQWWFWAYLQNWFLIFNDVGNTTTVIQHYWSLAVEEQFYIIWPFVIFLIRKPKWLLAIAGSLLLAVIFTRFYLWEIKVKDLNYFGLYTYTRIDGICIGSILAILHFMKSAFIKKYFTWLVLFMAATNFVFYFINRQFNFTYPYLAIVGYTTFAILFAIVVHELITGENKFINWILNISVLRFFGKISYGLYVYHWPVYLILYGWMEEKVKSLLSLPTGPLEIVVSVLLTLTGVLISIISFYTLENYFLKKKKAFN